MNSNDDSMDLVGNERVNKAKVYEAGVYSKGDLIKYVRLRGRANRLQFITDELACAVETGEYFETRSTDESRYVIEVNGGSRIIIVEEVK